MPKKWGLLTWVQRLIHVVWEKYPDFEKMGFCNSKIDTKFAVLFSGSQTVSWQSVSTSQHCIGGRKGGGGGGGWREQQLSRNVAGNKAFRSFVLKRNKTF